MTLIRAAAVVALLAVVAAALGANFVAPASYATQFRDHANARPSAQFPLGTDELGRDRLSRLLYGTRVSLLLAPAAALLSTLIAALIGLLAGYLAGWWERAAMAAADLFATLPWLFLLLAVRAMLPLNVRPMTSVSITFFLLGLLGWASGARVVRASVAAMKHSDFALQARAAGCSPARIVAVQVLPNLRPVLTAQFWLLVPVYILSEANLGMLGLGVSEPLPSWGNLLAELQNYHAIPSAPWLLAPAVALFVVLGSMHILFLRRESS